MSKPTLLLSPEGTFDASGRAALTVSGGVRVVTEAAGKAWQVAEAGTNLVPNPRAVETGTAWGLNVTNVARSYLTGETIQHPAGLTLATAARSTVTATPSSGTRIGLTFADTSAAGTVVTGQMLVRGGAGTIGKQFRLRAYELGGTGGTVYTDGPLVTLTADWQLLTVSRTTTNADHTQLGLYLWDAGASGVAGEIVDATAAMMEKKSYVTPYFDGTLGSGYAWSGTANASTSTRAAGYVYTTIAGRAAIEQGSLLMRYRLSGQPTQNSYVFDIGGLSGSGNAKAFYTVWNNGASWRMRDNVSSTITGSTRSTPNTAGEYTLYFAWDATNITVDFGDGVVQTFARATHDGTWLTDRLNLLSYTTGGQANATSRGILVFDQPLTETERAQYTAMSAWTWNSTFGQSAEGTFPTIASGLTRIDTTIHESDMTGTIGREITEEVTSAQVTSDIDRAGPKNQIDIAAVGELDSLKAGLWVTPVQRVAREGEPVQTVQRGVFQLGQPSIRTAGAQYEVSNKGEDIVTLLANSALLNTLYTPPRGWVMQDVEHAIRMVGITSMGPNLVTNGSFEQSGTGWTQSAVAGGTGTITHGYFAGDATYVIADGKLCWAPVHSSNVTAGAYVYVLQDFPVPAGWENLMVSIMRMQGGSNSHYTYASVRFLDSGGLYLASNTFIETPRTIPNSVMWQREIATGPIPEGAVTVRVLVFSYQTAVYAGSARMMVDDVQVRGITGDLLPASMLAFPPSTAKATSRIQHLASASRLAAVNDRLQAIGLMAVNATQESKYTSRPQRDPNRDAAARTYNLDTDIRLASEIEIERSTSNVYNRVFAVKEDTLNGTSMVAVAENKDTTDEWNIYKKQLTPKVVAVPNAIDMDALQAAADKELARASMQESVKFQTIADPSLTVYDIIEITGPAGHPVLGKWSIESLGGGLTAEDGLVTIGARRTKVVG